MPSDCKEQCFLKNSPALLSVFEPDRFIELVFRGERVCLRTGGDAGGLRGGELRVEVGLR